MMSDQATTPGNNISASMLHDFFSYHGNLMLVGVVSLLLVILFILFLHIFGRRCCFPQLTRNDGNRAATPYPHLFTTFAFVDDANSSNNQKAGLPPFAIASIPIFVYQENIRRLSELLECAICLGSFEDGEIGRRLPTCAHPFHVECIDMWLRSNFTCPICRSSAVVLREEDDDEKNTEITKQHFPNDSVPAGSDFV